MAVSLANEVFALRDDEKMQLLIEPPRSGRFIAVMARSIEMPPGERQPVRHEDGAPVEQAAILACHLGNHKTLWQWLQISPPSKERIGDLLFDNGAEKDRWYYLAVSDDLQTFDGEPKPAQSQIETAST